LVTDTFTVAPGVYTPALVTSLFGFTVTTPGTGYTAGVDITLTMAGAGQGTSSPCTDFVATVAPPAATFTNTGTVTVLRGGKCSRTALIANGIKFTVAAGGAQSGTAAVFSDTIAATAAAVDAKIASGLLRPYHDNSVSGRFQGYFALEFTDESGDTWMTESIKVNSRKVATTNTNQVSVVAGNDAILALDTQTKRANARVPVDHTGGMENNPEDDLTLNPDYADFIGTQAPNADRSSGATQWVSDFRSGMNVARRIEAALEALPNDAIGDVEVYYDYEGSVADHAAMCTGAPGVSQVCHSKIFQVSFVSNSGNVPALRVAYAFVDSDGSATADGTGKLESYSNGLCGGQTAISGSDASDTGNDGCTANAFGLATDLDTAGGVKALVNPAYNQYTAQYGVAWDGTTENAECSNRGLCDYATGTCKCFQGFIETDCSVQSAIAMA